MPFQIVAYDLLKADLQESVNTLIRSHNGDPNKLNESLTKLPDDRRIQAIYLLKSIKYLDISTTLKSDEKARVLNAAAFFVRNEIGESYKWISPEGSKFFGSLTTSLKLTKENMPDRDDLIDMYGPLQEFIRSKVYIESDPRKGCISGHPYTIKGFEVADHIKILTKKLYDWDNEIIDAAKPVVKGFLSSIWGSVAETPKKESPTGTTLGF